MYCCMGYMPWPDGGAGVVVWLPPEKDDMDRMLRLELAYCRGPLCPPFGRTLGMNSDDAPFNPTDVATSL